MFLTYVMNIRIIIIVRQKLRKKANAEAKETPEPMDAVILTLEEYETIRLLDKEGLSQEQCSDVMQVARTTVQKSISAPEKSWRMYWWTACPCELRADTISSVTGQCGLRMSKLL